MKNECFNIGTIQTFVDGELESEETRRIVRHVSFCDDCARLVAETESENEAAFGALECELNQLVPTERLREKVFSSIRENEIRESRRWLGTLAGFDLSRIVSMPGAAAFASVALMIGITGIAFWYGLSSFGQPVDRVEVNTAESYSETQPQILAGDVASAPAEIPDESVKATQTAPAPRNTFVARRASFSRVKANPRRVRQIAEIEPATTVAEISPPASAGLEAEDGYLRTISTLNRTVNENKDYILRPSERVAFERDLAVVNDAIMKMRDEVERDPENAGAREVLRASYQNKIDLLNSVAERSETVASLD